MKILIRFVTILLAIAILPLYLAQAEENAAPATSSGLEVYFLNLGRVDGIFIRADGETCFIDVGFERDAADAIPFLQSLGVTHLDSYVGTHGHSDHIDGAPEMIEAFRPDKIYISHIGCLSAILDCANEAQQQIISATERVILQPGDSFQLGRGYMTCLGPLSIRQCFTGSSHENDNSLILRLDYGRRSMLFTGDTSDNVLRAVNKTYPGSLNVDVLKNPHHNGAHDADVIDAIEPGLVVFCTDNKDQPSQAYRATLTERGIRMLITGSANQGSVAIVSDGERMQVRCGTSVSGVTVEQPGPLYVGQEFSLTASVSPPGALVPDRQLGWNSSDEAVAVAQNGRVLAISPGTTVVTAAALNGVSASVPVRVYSAVVQLEETAIKLAVGETQRVEGSIMPAEAEDIAGEWLSSDPAVATVSGGKVTGVSEGTAQIIARLSNGAESACEVTVSGVLARSVLLNRSKATMQVGDSLTLTAKVRPAEYDLNSLEWSSSDDSILWVDDLGNVTAVGTGKAKITVTASGGVSDVCTIRVK